MIAPPKSPRKYWDHASRALAWSWSGYKAVAFVAIDENWTALKAVINSIGVSSVESLKSVLLVEQDNLTTARAEPVIVGFGTRAVGWDNLVYGVLLVLFIIFLPKGILGSVIDRLKTRPKPPVPS